MDIARTIEAAMRLPLMRKSILEQYCNFTQTHGSVPSPDDPLLLRLQAFARKCMGITLSRPVPPPVIGDDDEWKGSFVAPIQQGLIEDGIEIVMQLEVDEMYAAHPGLACRPVADHLLIQVMLVAACCAQATVHGFDPESLLLPPEARRASNQADITAMRADGHKVLSPEEAAVLDARARRSLFDANERLLASMAYRQVRLMLEPDNLVVVVLNTKDHRWQSLVSVLMPGYDEGKFKNLGSAPIKVFSTQAPGFRQVLALLAPDAIEAFDRPVPGGRVRAVVFAGRGVETFYVLPAERSKAN